MVAEEWVTLMSCCPRIFLMGLVREGWKGRDTLRAYSRVCLLKAARDCRRGGLRNLRRTSSMIVVMSKGGNPFWRQTCRTVWSSASR